MTCWFENKERYINNKKNRKEFSTHKLWGVGGWGILELHELYELF